MCSTRKAPMGTMPESEWSLCQRKEWPWLPRRGCTPRSGGAAGGAGGAAVAMGTPSNHDECTVGKEKSAAPRLFRSGLTSVKETGTVCAVIVRFVRLSAGSQFSAFKLLVFSFSLFVVGYSELGEMR